MRLLSIPQMLLLVVFFSCLAALAAFGGWSVSALWQPKLVAEIRVQDFDLPANFSMDPNEVSDELSAQLQRRATSDAALRFLLGGEGQQQVAEVVVPRLLNAGVIRRMISEMDTLGTVLEATEFHGLVTGHIRNDGDTPLAEVALTLPGALRAEVNDGTVLDIAEPREDLSVVNFGTLEAGDDVPFMVWLDRPASTLAALPQFVRTGSRGSDGVVEMRGNENWFGADLEVAPWARWLIAGLLTLGTVLAFVALAMSVLVGRKDQPRRQQAERRAPSRG